ncbi:hypothetical protein M0802_010502 [Mischocyttarus mexicanus]|nr:hypothetical protein M0802_010502 [Mischocyttarus mexicanus]
MISISYDKEKKGIQTSSNLLLIVVEVEVSSPSDSEPVKPEKQISSIELNDRGGMESIRFDSIRSGCSVQSKKGIRGVFRMALSGVGWDGWREVEVAAEIKGTWRTHRLTTTRRRLRVGAYLVGIVKHLRAWDLFTMNSQKDKKEEKEKVEEEEESMIICERDCECIIIVIFVVEV